MKKQLVVKTEVAGVFPLIGSPEEGRNKKIRTLKNVGFRLTPAQAIDAALLLLQQAKTAQNGDKRTVLEVIARRKEGPSFLTVQTAVLPLERKKRVPKSKGEGQATAAPEEKSDEKQAVAAAPKRTRKQPKPGHAAEAHQSASVSEAA